MPYKDKLIGKQKAHERYMLNRAERLMECKLRRERLKNTPKYIAAQRRTKRKHYMLYKDKILAQRKLTHTSRRLRRNYDMSEKEYWELYELQGRCCAICKLPTDSTKIKKALPLFVDHDHSTGKVRGLVCHQCNILLGMAKNDMTTLGNALLYLQKCRNEPIAMWACPDVQP